MSRIFAHAVVEPTVSEVTEALRHAAEAAAQAPSIHNTQPWHWEIGDAGLDLYIDRRRLLGTTDPAGRLALISCGAALHHARTALAAAGWLAEVIELPSQKDPDHLAHLSLYDRRPSTAEALHRARMMRLRHTDRRPVAPSPIDPDSLLAITIAVEDAGGWLYLIPRDRVVALGAAIRYAQEAEIADEPWRAEMAQWTGGDREQGTGVPDAVIPDRATLSTVPSRDFGHPGSLAVGEGHDLNATYAILYGPQDLPVDWLHAGQALSAGWLTATDIGVCLLPMSAATEIPESRQVLRRMLAGLGQPYLVLRLGIPAPGGGRLRTPRLTAGQTIVAVPD